MIPVIEEKRINGLTEEVELWKKSKTGRKQMNVQPKKCRHTAYYTASNPLSLFVGFSVVLFFGFMNIRALNHQATGCLKPNLRDDVRSVIWDLNHGMENRLKASLMSVNRLGYKEMFPVPRLGRHAGSFALTENNSVLVFSPGNYTGILYVFRKQQAEQWEFDRTIRGREPGIDPYHVYASESIQQGEGFADAHRNM